MSYLEYAHLPSGRRSRLAALTERVHGRIALLDIDPNPRTPAANAAPSGATNDPHEAFRLATEAGFSGVTAPIGLAETYHPDYAEILPLVLDLNPGTSHDRSAPCSASVEDALRLDAHAISFTFHDPQQPREEELARFHEVRSQAHRYGLPVLVRAHRPWEPQARGTDHPTAFACTAAVLGADLVEVSLPNPIDIDDGHATDSLIEALRAACATPVLLKLDGGADPTLAAHVARAAADAGCAGITVSQGLWDRNHREALHQAARLRDQLAA